MEPTRQDNGIKAMKEAKKLVNKRRSILSRKEMNEIIKKLHKKEAVYNFLKEKEQKGGLTNRENRVLKNIYKYLKNFKNNLEKLQKYQYNITYGLDCLFNELNEEDYYKPTEVKSAFDGSFLLYESKGDKDNKLAIYEYFDIIRPYLKDMIDDHKANPGNIRLDEDVLKTSFVFFFRRHLQDVFKTS